MMQASEYYPHEYLRWYARTIDFSDVEKRKVLVMTTKVRILLAAGYGIAAAMLSLVFWGLGHATDASYAIALIAFVSYPAVIPYLILSVLLFLNLLQRPLEKRILAKARLKLKEHKGVRIAIAGSYGKTTMREILKVVLSEGKKVAAPPGSFNTPLGIASFISKLKGDEDIILFELGEYYPGDIHKLCHFVEPHHGVITGVNEAHLERFGSLEKTRATIFELSDWLRDKPVYVNGEDMRIGDFGSKHIRYSRQGAGKWKVDASATDLSGTWITLSDGASSISVVSKLLGLHIVGPLVAAADIASKLGLSNDQIQVGLSKTVPFEHRMQLREESGIVIIDDSYNGNPDGVTAAIEFLKGINARRWFVTPGLVEMGSRNQEVHQKIGTQLAEAGIEKIVLIKDSVTPYIEEGLRSKGFPGKIYQFDDMPKALNAIRAMTLQGDVVLIQNDWPDQYA